MVKRSKHFYEFGPFRLDPARRLLFRQEEVIPLTPKVLHTLLVLVENRGRVVAKDELMKAVWPDTFVEEGNLTQNISMLRKVLGESPGEHVYIETVPKQGYRFIVAATEASEPLPQFPGRSRWVWAAALAAVAILSGVLWYFGRRPPVTRSLAITPLTSYPGLELHPSLSPDGNQVAFAWTGERRDNLDIYFKVVGSDRSQRLTFDAARDYRPAWSPDGRWIAFLRGGSGRPVSIMRIPSAGGPESRVAVVNPGYLAGYDQTPLLAWTPDGKWLLTSDRAPPDEASSLFLISVESGEKKRLTTPPPVSLGDLTASINGRTLAFSRSQSGTLGKVCTLELSAEYSAVGEPICSAISDQRLANIGGVNWMPDRRAVMFSPLFNGSGKGSLWILPLHNREGSVAVPERFPIPSDSARDPAISRDGRRLVYSDFRVDADVWRVDLQPGKPPAPVRLISSTHFDRTADYSPDGRKIAFNSTRSGHPAIWLADSDGSNHRQLTLQEFPLVGPPRWSPDGQRIAFDSTVGGQFELYRINADGSELRRLTNYPGADAVPSWSRDGQWIYFVSTRSGTHEIWKMPAEGGEPTRLTKHGGDGAVFESTDRKSVYFTKTRDGTTSLWRIPITGGAEMKVLDRVFRLQFAVAAAGVYFVARTEEGLSIRFLNVRTNEVTTITSIDGVSNPGLSVSPDGRFLLYSFTELIGSDLMLVENFR